MGSGGQLREEGRGREEERGGHPPLSNTRLLYAASAWHGFTKASERQRINSLLDRAKRYGYCDPSLVTFEVLCQIVSGANNVLHTLLPPLSTASQHYNLRRRTHTYSLPGHDSYLCDFNLN